LTAPGPEGDQLAPPWPNVLIATGRQTVAVASAIRRASGGGTFTVQIQDPRVPPKRFDVVVVPRHDGLAGENVVTTEGALHRITTERLQAARDRFRAALAHLPRPLVAVLLGGANKQYRLTAAATDHLVTGLVRLAREHGAGLAVTPSRRTGAAAEAVLRQALRGLPAVIWDGAGDNPYFGYLAWADAIVVTSDSVNMVSEACATGKPVYVFHLDGGSDKFRRFHDNLERRGLTRPFDGRLETWSPPAFNEMAAVAAAIRIRLEARQRYD
jgi:mitochondrial fission protein ELM1